MVSEKMKAYRKKWKKENRERINRRARERYAESDVMYENQKRWQEDHRDQRNETARNKYTTDGRWKKQLKDRFGITPEKYWSMHADQEGLCAICHKEQCVGTKLDVDHDHETGKVRGLLCRHCNTGIGLLKDSIYLIGKALSYLTKWKNLDTLGG